MVRVHFLGGAREVGRSAILLETSERKILLDAGIKLGEEPEMPLIERPKDIDIIVLTHAHLDHAGYVPFLVKNGFRGHILATPPTRDLCQVLWADFLRIAKERGEKPFTESDMRAALKRFKTVEYGERTKVGDVYITLVDAGHILGSAQVMIEEGDCILYSGDINIRPTRLHKGAEVVPANVLIMESTYGGKEDLIPSYKKLARELVKIVVRTLNRGGSVLIPVFAIGRAQEVLLTLEAYMRSGQIPRTPIVIDGMVSKANRIYRKNVLYLREEIWKHILITEQDPFKSPFYTVPRTKDRRDVLNKQAIIVAPSGMLTGGPSVYYLEKLAGDPKNAVILVGYQAKNTPGRQLLEGKKDIHIAGKEIRVEASVHLVHMSAHADRRDLITYAKRVGAKHIYLVHGEEEKAIDLADALDASVPALGDTYDLRA